MTPVKNSICLYIMIVTLWLNIERIIEYIGIFRWEKKNENLLGQKFFSYSVYST